VAIDHTTPVGQVRLLIADTTESALTLTDQQVEGYLGLYGGTAATSTLSQTRRAAADALDAIATSEALVSKVIRTHDLSTDGAKLADVLRKQAATLRAQADTADDDAAGGFLDVAEFSPYPGGVPELTERPLYGWP
jgi:hypothetical protein